MLSMLISPIVNPVLPYWLRIRYKLYMLVARLRKQALIEKYKHMALQKMWLAEPWLLVEDEDEGEQATKEDSSAQRVESQPV